MTERPDQVTEEPVAVAEEPAAASAAPAAPGEAAGPASAASGPASETAGPAGEAAGPASEASGPASAATGAAFLRLVEVMDTLRVSCPWDARQTHESLAPHLLEECYEALEALEGGEEDALRDELGDVLLQVVFHARIAAERGDGTGFTVDDVATGIVEKLIRRHPHVFGDVQVSGPEEVKQNWDAIKAAERAGLGGPPPSVVGSVPFSQPALALAAQLQRRAERAGAPAELANLPASGNGSAGGVSDIGAELFALVAKARAAGLDPELELRAAARSYRDRVRTWEQARNGAGPG